MEVIRDLFVQEWLRRYPRPSRIIFDAGGEFDNQEFHKALGGLVHQERTNYGQEPSCQCYC